MLTCIVSHCTYYDSISATVWGLQLPGRPERCLIFPAFFGAGSWRSSREHRSAWTGKEKMVCPAIDLMPFSPCARPQLQLYPLMTRCMTSEDIASMLKALWFMLDKRQPF